MKQFLFKSSWLPPCPLCAPISDLLASWTLSTHGNRQHLFLRVDLVLLLWFEDV